MDIAGLAKGAITLVASLGVGSVIGNVIKSTTPDNLKLVQKIGVAVGTIVICDVLAEQASKLYVQSFEDGVAAAQAVRAELNGEVITIEESVEEGIKEEWNDED